MRGTSTRIEIYGSDEGTDRELTQLEREKRSKGEVTGETDVKCSSIVRQARGLLTRWGQNGYILRPALDSIGCMSRDVVVGTAIFLYFF